MSSTSPHHVHGGLLPPSIVVGTAAAVAMWCAWYILHLPGLTAGSEAAATILAALLFLVVALSAAKAHIPSRREGWVVGLTAGLVSAAINMLLLGSKVVVQPASTDDLQAVTNQLRPDALAIVIGFFAFSAIIGAFAGFVGTTLAPRLAQPTSWFRSFALVAAIAFVPLLIIGGIVTSTESGMAVPDSVTTYGSVSFLFPLSLMAEPRIYFEHTHRLFGSLVGLTTVILAIWAIARDKAWKPAVATLALLAAILMPFIARAADTLDQNTTMLLMGSAVLISLALALDSLRRSTIPWLACMLLTLVVGQGLLGALRVSEISTPIAMVHGVLAQLVFGCAAALAAHLAVSESRPLPVPPQATRKAINAAARFGPWVVLALFLQLILGAGYRHTQSHAFLGGHVLFAVVVSALVVVLGSLLTNSDRFSEVGSRARRACKALIHLVGLQVLLGIIAVAFVAMGETDRPIPLSHELDAAHALPTLEALFTTAHQATGAALLALTIAVTVATRLRSTTNGFTIERAI